MLSLNDMMERGIVNEEDAMIPVTKNMINAEVLRGVIDVWNSMSYEHTVVDVVFERSLILQSRLLLCQASRSFGPLLVRQSHELATLCRNRALFAFREQYGFSEQGIDALGEDMIRLMSEKGADYGQSVLWMLPTSSLDIMTNKMRRIASIARNKRQAVKTDAPRDEHLDILGYSLYLNLVLSNTYRFYWYGCAEYLPPSDNGEPSQHE